MRPSILVVILVALCFAPAQAGDEDEIELVLTEPLRLEDVLKAVGRITHATFVWDPNAAPLRSAELVSARNLKAPRVEFFALTRGLLASYGLGLVSIDAEGHGVWRVVDLARVGDNPGISLEPSPVELTEKTLPWLREQQGMYVSATLRVAGLEDHDAAADALRALGSGHGLCKVAVVAEAGVIAVTDFAPVVARLHDALQKWADLAAGSDLLEVIVIEHAQASDLARTLSVTFDDVTIVPDVRTNQLIVSGAQARVAQLKEAVSRLDVRVHVEATWTHVLHLKHVQAEEIGEALQRLLGDAVRIEPFEAKNALLVTGTPHDFETLNAIVDQLDKE